MVMIFCKLYEDLFLTESGRSNWLGEGIQSEDLSKTRCNTGDKKTLGADKEKKRLNAVYGNKCRIPIDHEILKDHGQELYPMYWSLNSGSLSRVLS